MDMIRWICLEKKHYTLLTSGVKYLYAIFILFLKGRFSALKYESSIILLKCSNGGNILIYNPYLLNILNNSLFLFCFPFHYQRFNIISLDCLFD